MNAWFIHSAMVPAVCAIYAMYMLRLFAHRPSQQPQRTIALEYLDLSVLHYVNVHTCWNRDPPVHGPTDVSQSRTDEDSFRS